PFAFHEWKLVIPAAIVLGLVSVAPGRLSPASLRFAVALAVAAVALALLTTTGPAGLVGVEWPLLLLGAVALVVVLGDRRHGSAAVMALGAVVLLGAVYLLKNPSLTRYFGLLLPAVALLVGLGISALRYRLQPLGVAAVAVVAAVGVHHSLPGSRDY